jgi:hypothetical protein
MADRRSVLDEEAILRNFEEKNEQVAWSSKIVEDLRKFGYREVSGGFWKRYALLASRVGDKSFPGCTAWFYAHLSLLIFNLN